MTTGALKRALCHPDMAHRRSDFEAILARLRKNLLRLVRADENYTAVVISGSGTAANETALSSIVRDSDEVLLIKNGAFGQRLDDILTCYDMSVYRLEYAWGEPPAVDDIEAALEKHPRVNLVCMVYHETSSGMRNPIASVTSIAKRHGCRTFLDCVSAVGGEDIDVIRDQIDILTGVGNKAIGGMTGTSFVIAKRSSIPDADSGIRRRNIYLNLQSHIMWAERCEQTPNTPSVTMIIALDQAVEDLLDEGLDTRIKRYQGCRKVVRDGLSSLGLRLLLPEELSSNTVTSAFLPQGVSLDEFIDRFEERGFIVYPGKGVFEGQNMFQVATMGCITADDCESMLFELSGTLDDLKAASLE